MLLKETEFSYAVGRIRKLEDWLLNSDILTRMADAHDFESAFTILNETTYAKHMTKLKEAFDFEDLIRLELLITKNLIEYLAPDNKILRSFWLKFDIINAKALLKAKFLGLEEAALINYGTIDAYKLKNYIFEGIDEIPKELRFAISKTVLKFEKASDPQIIDNIMDKFYYSHTKNIAEENKISFLIYIIMSAIDLVNLKTFIRAKESKKDKENFKHFILPGGKIKEIQLFEAYDRGVDDIVAKFKYTPYLQILSSGIEYYGKNKSFSLLEKLMDDYIIEYIKSAKRISFGIEPLIAFQIAKETETRNLRAILICKKNNLKEELIKERLRIPYV